MIMMAMMMIAVVVVVVVVRTGWGWQLCFYCINSNHLYLSNIQAANHAVKSYANIQYSLYLVD